MNRVLIDELGQEWKHYLRADYHSSANQKMNQSDAMKIVLAALEHDTLYSCLPSDAPHLELLWDLIEFYWPEHIGQYSIPPPHLPDQLTTELPGGPPVDLIDIRLIERDGVPYCLRFYHQTISWPESGAAASWGDPAAGKGGRFSFKLSPPDEPYFVPCEPRRGFVPRYDDQDYGALYILPTDREESVRDIVQLSGWNPWEELAAVDAMPRIVEAAAFGKLWCALKGAAYHTLLRLIDWNWVLAQQMGAKSGVPVRRLKPAACSQPLAPKQDWVELISAQLSEPQSRFLTFRRSEGWK